MKTKAQLLEDKGINLKNRISGSIKTTCPECSLDRKRKTDPCLSVNIDEGIYNCHHCDFKGAVFMQEKKEYTRPVQRLEKVSKKVIEWFEGRGISNNTLLRFQISEAKEWMPQFEKEVNSICFNYYRDEQLVNIKFRGPEKSFKLSKGSELIFYNLDSIKNEDTVIIVEGEMDCLSMYEAGIYNCLSVPNGASKGSQKLEYLDNCYQSFTGKTKIILAVDNDEAGYSLREELARRFGKERCFKVVFPEGCKDANEVLLKHGKEALRSLISEIVEYPIEGVFTMEDLFDDVQSFFYNGYPEGIKIGIPGLDDHLQLMPGQLTIMTAVPGSGKSEFSDLIMVKTAINHGWSWGVCSFENQPSSLHVTKLIEKFEGKSFSFRKNKEDRITENQFEHGIVKVDKYFNFININQIDLTLDGILEKASELVLRKGIKGLVIDPWNYIEHKIPYGYTETQYISESLTKIKAFCLKYGVHVILIAHPTKMKKDGNGKYEVPTLYSISGSAHFFNKTDNGICVHRDFLSNMVDVYIQKVRYSWLGKIGFCSFTYDVDTRQYYPIGEIKQSNLIPIKNLNIHDQEDPF